MKKVLLLTLILFSLFFSLKAHPVDLQTAQSIAAKFMGTQDLQLSATYQTDQNKAAFYIFNTPDGFVIVSADDCETPIIGYSNEGCFDPNNIPIQMEDYLQDYVARIQYGIENHLEADELTAKQWELVKTTGQLNDRKDSKNVEPLLTEKWHQGCLYNSLCPEMNGPCDHAEVGCVAVAMGQIMHYWGYPATGWGSNAYYNLGVQLSADFGNTTYDWEHMPDSLTDASSEEEIAAVSTLLYHCGVAVNMAYSTNGSSANAANVPDVLKRYFDFSRQLHSDPKGNDNEAWLAKLKDCLDLQRPIFYSGQGSAGGHAFVCDGYDNNDLLHFNWGWGGPGDGYFALGNLNPIGYTFNNHNYAIFDIFPQYEPCVVSATVYPPTAGTIEGNGEYHLGEQCTLTAIPSENCEFHYWKKDGRITSYNTTMTINVESDIDDIEALFYYRPIKEITACYAPDTNDVNSPYVSLLWDYDDNPEWPLLKQFEINGKSVTTDGEYIYTSKQSYNVSGSSRLEIRKYTMDGDSVGFSSIDGIHTNSIACDDNHLYCGNGHIYTLYLYRINFGQNVIVDSINMNFRAYQCAYDAAYDSFWLSAHPPGKGIVLVNRQGETIGYGPNISATYIYGFGRITAEDGNPHLLISENGIAGIRDYDISDESFKNHSITFSPQPNGLATTGTCIGKYDGKDALFAIAHRIYEENYTIYIYEINMHLACIMHYRLYRADSEGHVVMLADEVTGTSFIDHSWDNIVAGEYRFGISEVYFNGVESEIIWSDPILKPTDSLEENIDVKEDPEPSVQKVIEEGHIVIIKDGKRYNVSGQQLN